MRKKKKVAIYTLGCKLNQAESSAIADALNKNDYQIVRFDEMSDVYIINTCTVTHTSDSKSRQAIRKAIKRNPNAFVVVTGCYAQICPEEIAKIKGVNLIVGNFDKQNIPMLLNDNFMEDTFRSAKIIHNSSSEHFIKMPISNYDRTRAFVKIQEGCKNYCSYCIIPYARGMPRSCKPDDIFAEIEKLIKRGYREIVLTGIHVGSYGLDIAPPTNFTELVGGLVELAGEFRIRVSSIEPNEITEELINIIAQSDKLCAHLHIPLQSGDDSILSAMRRKYDTSYYEKLIKSIRNRIPDIAITTDVMVGFPGEDEETFKNTYDFCKKIHFSEMHVFKYSIRKGTPAAQMHNQVAAEDKECRSRKLINLAYEMSKTYRERFLGKRLNVLIEKVLGGHAEGISNNYLRVNCYTVGNKKLLKGSLSDVKIENIDDDKLRGVVI